MKYKILFMGLTLGLGATGLMAQSEPQKPTYEHKLYEADGNYYLQRSMPVYLKFSVTPDGKNYPLRSKQHPEDADPMYLDAEGIHYIRHKWAVDPNTGKPVSPQREATMEIYADGLPPRTTLRFENAPRYVRGGTTFFGKNLSFVLTARDAVSGVAETQYAVDGGYTQYSGDVGVNSEGAKTLFYYSADNVGNVEDTRQSNFTVDLTPPTSSHSIEGIVHNSNILAPSTKFKLSTEDNLSGVRVTRYSFDAGSDRNFKGSISMSGPGLQDGEHTLYYYATDNVDNTAEKKTFKFYLDRIPPVADASIVGDRYDGNVTYVSARTKFNISATDNKAGVKNIYYRINEGELNTFSGNFNLPDQYGRYSIKYDANDNVDNLSANKYLNVFLDNRAPQTRINYGKPQFFDRDTLFINKDTKITLPRSDQGSGIKKTEYSIDGGAWQDYSEFTIPGEGFHTIKFRSTDNVNNVEKEKESEVFVDNTPPEIFVNFSIKPIGERRGMKVYPNYVRMYVGATDKHTGTEIIKYSINDGPMTLYSSPQTLDASERNIFQKNKKYSVKVVAKDKLGNTAEKTFEFLVGPDEE